MSTNTVVERDAIEFGVSSILEKMTAKWERAFDARIGSETRLASDLGFDSIQLVQLVVKIQEYFKLKSLPFHKLLLSEENATLDLTVANVVDFLEQVLKAPDEF